MADNTPIFIDVTTGNTFTGLLDDFAKIQHSSEQENTEAVAQLTSEQTSNDDPTNTCLLVQSRKIRCPECNRYTAENAEKLARHIRKTHRGENPFQCCMCDYSTYNKVLFEEHVRIHQGIKPFKCSFCPHRNVSKKNLKKHELIHRPDNPLKCPLCDHIAKHRRGFAYHAKKYHSENTDSDSGVHKCKMCNKKFNDTELLNLHAKIKKKCDLCDYTACVKSLITTHKETEHGTKVKKEKKCSIFKCTLCDWTSNSRPRILLHLIHHPNQAVDENIVDISILKDCGIMT